MTNKLKLVIIFPCFLFILFFAFFFICLARVDALTDIYGLVNDFELQTPTWVQFYSRSSGKMTPIQTHENNLSSADEYNRKTRFFYFTPTSNYSAMAFVPTTSFKANTYYSLTIYYRFSSQNNLISQIGGLCVGASETCLNTQNFNVNIVYKQITPAPVTLSSSLATSGFTDMAVHYVNFVIKPTQTQLFFAMYFNHDVKERFTFYGYQVEALGQSSDEVINALSGQNSNLQSSLNQANGKLDTVQQQNKELQKQNEEIQKQQDEIKQKQEETNNTLKDDNVDDSSASGFFDNFENNDHGLSGVITAPLNFIKSMTSKTCSNIHMKIPITNTDFNLPCFSNYYNQHFGSLFTVYRTVTFGLVAYYVCVQLFAMVKGFKNPEDDKVEVVEL